ncbi:Inactive dipeptidyl peptidase 10, partial [Trichinella sp. T8]
LHLLVHWLSFLRVGCGVCLLCRMSEEDDFSAEVEYVSDKELMTGDAPQRNWWGIGIALLVILTITAIISVTIVLLAPNSDKSNDNVTPFTIEDIVHPKANEVNPGIIWLSVDTFAYKDAKCNIWLVSIFNHQINRTLLIDDRSCQNRHIVSYKPSATAQYIAFSYETRQFVRQRWSTLVKVRVLNSHFDYPVGPSKTGDEFIQLFLWNSQELSNDLVYIYEYNIYYQANVTAPSEQITFSGVENKISNGIADWLYEEEIFGTHKAVWWSPSGNHLAFVVFNDTQVSNITMSYYSEEPYPTNVNIPYPKVGASLPEAKVHVWNKKTKQTITFSPPDEVQRLKENYVYHVSWLKGGFSEFSNEDTLLVVWSNRVQNSVFISLCKLSSEQCILNYNQNFTNFWAEPLNFAVRFADEQNYFVILPKSVEDESEKQHYWYSHIAKINVPVFQSGQNGKAVFLTDGPWEVIEIVGYSEKDKELFFLAALPLPRQRHLYSVSIFETTTSPKCWTCNMTKDGCSYVDVHFAPKGDHYILYCQGPETPTVHLKSLHSAEFSYEIENNTALRQFYSTKLFPVVSYKEIQLPNQQKALLKILYPPGFEENANKEFYPAVLRVYAGPNSQQVVEKWSVSFDTYLASAQKYIVLYIDARGSAYRGSKYTAPLYKNIGQLEIEDQIDAFKAFCSQYGQVDLQRTAVWGWVIFCFKSYGGFAAARIVQMDEFQIFKCASSVAPVTDFRFYDAAYTERYLGLYEDNVVSYEKTNLMKNVTAFKLGKYLLIHGSFDDNVHYQNTAAFISALTANNVNFQLMVYTNENHSIGNRRMHLNTLLDRFFKSCFA